MLILLVNFLVLLCFSLIFVCGSFPGRVGGVGGGGGGGWEGSVYLCFVNVRCFLRLIVCLFICLFVCLFVRVFVCLFVCLFVRLLFFSCCLCVCFRRFVAWLLLLLRLGFIMEGSGCLLGFFSRSLLSLQQNQSLVHS